MEKYFIKQIEGREVLEPKYVRVENLNQLLTSVPQSDYEKLNEIKNFYLENYRLTMTNAHALRLAVHCFDKSSLESGGEALYWQTKAPQFFHFDENHPSSS